MTQFIPNKEVVLVATCNTCKGRKVIILPMKTMKSSLLVGVEAVCPDCKGTGEVGNPGACPRCNDSKIIILSAEESPLGVAVEVSCPDCSAPQAFS
ncbi:MAG: hypothetical protein HYS57_02585 [Parcubacteria group bacterium]|nr:hypothetical protein [Parcubacteria group bacterium]